MTSKAQDIKGGRREGFFTSESASGLVQTCLCRIGHKPVSRTFPHTVSRLVRATLPGIPPASVLHFEAVIGSAAR